MRKIGLLSLALVLALGAIGVGYAAWTQTLYIEGTVETGTLCAQLGTVEIRDPHQPVNPGGDYPTALPDYTCNDGFVPRQDGLSFWLSDKNVGWGEVERVLCPETQLYKTAKVKLHNAYPSYFNEVTFYVMNCGTLPWRIDHVIIRWDQVGDEQEFLVTSAGTHIQMDYTGDGEFELELMWGDNFGFQMHPDDIFPPEVSFWIHVLQPAPQDSTLEFTAELVVVQWNKYPLRLVR